MCESRGVHGGWVLRCASRLTAWLLVIAVALPSIAAAQNTISGCIKDSHGGVLPGVEVVASTRDGSTTTVTDARGCYQVRYVTSGAYSVTAQLAGFTTARREGVAVTDGRAVEALDFVLCTAALEEIDWVFPAEGLLGLWNQTEAVVILRIASTTNVQTECPGRNDFVHVATILRVVKDANARPLDRTITFRQENWSGERAPYAVGQEMIIFMHNDSGEWRRTMGPHSAFLIRNNRIVSLGWSSEVAGLTPDAFVAKLEALSK